MCLILTKIRYSKNLRPENKEFLLDFCFLRTTKGYRLSRTKERKALKINIFRLFRITFANLEHAARNMRYE